MAKKAAPPKKKQAPPTKAAPPSKESKLSKPKTGGKLTAAEIIERGRRIASAYLERRDGLDAQLAMDIVEGMTEVEVDALITEANDITLALVPKGGILVAPPEETIPSFTLFEPLVGNADFPELVLTCVEQSRIKNVAEKAYKSKKAELLSLLKGAGITKVECMEIKMTVYPGKGPRTLSDIKLIEKGVDPAIIAQCWTQVEYEDVRITAPKVEV